MTMLAALIAQAEGQGADLVTLRALVEEATEAGATRALTAIGLSDERAGADIVELRQLIQGWRDAKRSAVSAVVTWAVRAAVAALLVGLAAKTGLTGLIHR
ncbi:MAG: hypothetical protein JO290_14100 [Sphingomonadaceae bacterium]|nr:hypothetical protein [Sphingomonadaceae bacterium]